MAFKKRLGLQCAELVRTLSSEQIARVLWEGRHIVWTVYLESFESCCVALP